MDSRLNEPTLAASDVRELAGLTYRQLNEWDKRDALPHDRKGENGWRRVNAWQAIALSIAGDLQRRFGVPVAQLAKLTTWMLGSAPKLGQYMKLLRAEDLLCDFSVQEKSRHNAKVQEVMGAGEVNVIETTAHGMYTMPAPKPLHGRAAERSIEASVALTVPRLTKRGWAPEAADEFARTFYTLAVAQRFGTDGVAEIIALKRLVDAVGDKQAGRALNVLAGALLPLFDAFVFMSSGFRVLLLTDFEQSVLLDELDYGDRVRAGVLPSPLLVLEVNDHVNRVFQACGAKTLPVTVRSADMEPANGRPATETEREILTLLRKRQFDRLIVEPRDGGYRFELESNLSVADEHEVVRILQEHAYQSMTLKKHDGKFVRVTQSASMKIPVVADGKAQSCPDD